MRLGQITAACSALTLTFALTACGGSDEPADSSQSSETTAAEAETTEAAETETEAAETEAAETAGDGEAAACGDLTTADISEATGGLEFADADDTSVDQDITCTFTALTATYGVTVSQQSTADMLGGELEGLPTAEANAKLQLLAEMTPTDPSTTAIAVAGTDAIVTTGTTVIGSPTAVAAVVIGDQVYRVTVDGAEITDQAAVAAAVLDLAAA